MISLCRVGFGLCWVGIYVLLALLVASVCNGELGNMAAIGGGLCAMVAGQQYLNKLERVVRRYK